MIILNFSSRTVCSNIWKNLTQLFADLTFSARRNKIYGQSTIITALVQYIVHQFITLQKHNIYLVNSDQKFVMGGDVNIKHTTLGSRTPLLSWAVVFEFSQHLVSTNFDSHYLKTTVVGIIFTVRTLSSLICLYTFHFTEATLNYYYI